MTDSIQTEAPAPVKYKVGGQEYEMKMVKQCHTCSSPYRNDIEQAIINGYGYAGIARNLPEDANVTEENIGRHVRNGHMPLEQSLRHQILEDRARELGRNLETAGSAAVDSISFARMGIQQCYEDIAQG